MNVHYAKFMIYFEIHRLDREGQSIRQIAEYLVMDRRTVKKYLSMSEADYEAFVFHQSARKKLLGSYEDFVRERLEQFRDTSAAQMHDWLKEHFADFPKVSPKTVFNFVCWVRDKHRLPLVAVQRDYQMVAELPYGQQAQVDFGEYNMRTSLGSRVKVFFFTMVMSRSRYKYIWFADRYFTTELAIFAHQKAFEFIGGVPDEVVYDQDKLFIVSENGGDIILTSAFRAYTRQQSFALHFCRKSDPESKGKIENVVKYVKRNFLYNRTYYNIETLNDEAIAWLGRTANGLVHTVTGKRPLDELMIERDYLSPCQPLLPKPVSEATYAVRKDNTVCYRGNYYSLPLGTFKGKQTLVCVRIELDELWVLDPDSHQPICKHVLAIGRGNKVINSNHLRDNSQSIREMTDQVAALFPDGQKALEWLEKIRQEKPRYIRDQLISIREAIATAQAPALSAVLDYCMLHQIHRASDFKSLLASQSKPKPDPKIIPLNPLSGKIPENARIQPQQSAIADYESLLAKKDN